MVATRVTVFTASWVRPPVKYRMGGTTIPARARDDTS
jgi:hypothetical protein